MGLMSYGSPLDILDNRCQSNLRMGSLNVKTNNKAAVFYNPSSDIQHWLCGHNPNFHHSRALILDSACESHLQFLIPGSYEILATSKLGLDNWLQREVGLQEQI